MFFKEFFGDERLSFCFDEISKIKGSLLPEEEIYIKNAVSSRKQEFMAGRSALRETLSKWGRGSYPILVGHHRMPVLPENFIGSISHTSKYVAAVSAEASSFTAIGIDIEEIGRVTEDLWHLILTPQEIDLVRQKSDNLLADLFFSAKEAFFKMQYPLTGQIIDFKDVVINPCCYPNTIKVDCQDSRLSGCEGKYYVDDNILCSLFYI